MKKSIVLLVLIIGTTSFAATVGNWISAGGAGSWSDPAMWAAGAVPVTTAGSSDEIKINSSVSSPDVTINYAANYNCRLSTAGNEDTPTIIRIANGADFQMGEFRVASRGVSSGMAAVANVYQTGGTLTVGDLVIGRYASGGIDPVRGSYTISDGTIAYKNNGRLYVGAQTGSSGYYGAQGTFTVEGNAASITMKKLYVGARDATTWGTGTMEFKAGANGVSAVKLADADSIQLDLAGASSTTNLVVSLTSTAPIADILLIENTNTGAVNGRFDTINGIDAVEGAQVNLGGTIFTLTYLYDGTGDELNNDIALIVPEPITIALFGFGLLVIRRKNK